MKKKLKIKRKKKRKKRKRRKKMSTPTQQVMVMMLLPQKKIQPKNRTLKEKERSVMSRKPWMKRRGKNRLKLMPLTKLTKKNFKNIKKTMKEKIKKTQKMTRRTGNSMINWEMPKVMSTGMMIKLIWKEWRIRRPIFKKRLRRIENQGNWEEIFKKWMINRWKMA